MKNRFNLYKAKSKFQKKKIENYLNNSLLFYWTIIFVFLFLVGIFIYMLKKILPVIEKYGVS